jgi:hypothetical protein
MERFFRSLENEWIPVIGSMVLDKLAIQLQIISRVITVRLDHTNMTADTTKCIGKSILKNSEEVVIFNSALHNASAIPCFGRDVRPFATKDERL